MTAPRRYTLASARRLRGSLVYGLLDENGVIFYVGKTTNPKKRFWDHSEASPHNIQLRRRMERAGRDLRVVVLVRDPPNLAQSEMDEIVKRSQDLVNVAGNPFRRKSRFQLGPNSREKMGLCPTCDGRLDRPRGSHCSACARKLSAKAITPRGCVGRDT